MSAAGDLSVRYHIYETLRRRDVAVSELNCHEPVREWKEHNGEN